MRRGSLSLAESSRGLIGAFAALHPECAAYLQAASEVLAELRADLRR